VVCESVKFTGSRAPLDSISMNELGDGDGLVGYEQSETLTTISMPTAAPIKGGEKGGKEDESDGPKQKEGLEGWKDQSNLYLLNLMYDSTPAEFIDMVVTELGILPPSAVPVVNGVHGGDD